MVTMTILRGVETFMKCSSSADLDHGGNGKTKDL